MLKTVRIIRIGKLISNLNATRDAKSSIKVIYVSMILVLYTHWIACTLWTIFI
jgi:hypothetical protein